MTLTGKSSLIGRLTAVAGLSAEMVTHKGRTIIAPILSSDVADQLRARIGHVVAVDGFATWDVEADWHLVEFEISELTPYDDQADMKECLARLRELVGPYWDKVDLDEWMREERGD